MQKTLEINRIHSESPKRHVYFQYQQHNKLYLVIQSPRCLLKFFTASLLTVSYSNFLLLLLCMLTIVFKTCSLVRKTQFSGNFLENKFCNPRISSLLMNSSSHSKIEKHLLTNYSRGVDGIMGSPHGR